MFNFYDLSLWSCVVQSLCHIWLFLIPWIAACQSPLSSAIFQSLFKLMSTESVIPSKRFILCHPLLLLPSIFASIRVFSNKSALPIRWPDYWSFGFNIGPANEYSDLISFGIDWFDLLAIQRTLKSLLQHHISKASILWHSTFFMTFANKGPYNQSYCFPVVMYGWDWELEHMRVDLVDLEKNVQHENHKCKFYSRSYCGL